MRLSPENVLRPNAMNGEIISMDSNRLLFVWNISQIFTWYPTLERFAAMLLLHCRYPKLAKSQI